MDRREHHHAAGRNLGDGLVVCVAPWRRGRANGAGNRSTRQLGGDSVAESHSEVLLGRVGFDLATNAVGSRHCALRRRGRCVLWLSAIEMVAVQRDSNVAHSIGIVLDRHGLAGGGLVHRAAGERAGAERATTRSQRFVPRSVGRCGLLVERRVAEHPQQVVRHDVVLFRTSRVRIRRPRTGVANCAVRRVVVVAISDDSRVAPGIAKDRGSKNSSLRCWPSPRAPSPSSTVRA